MGFLSWGTTLGSLIPVISMSCSKFVFVLTIEGVNKFLQLCSNHFNFVYIDICLSGIFCLNYSVYFDE